MCMDISKANKMLERATDKIGNAVETMFKVYLKMGYTNEQAQRQIINVLRSWEDEIKHG
jgi:hypothetical protein